MKRFRQLVPQHNRRGISAARGTPKDSTELSNGELLSQFFPDIEDLSPTGSGHTQNNRSIRI